MLEKWLWRKILNKLYKGEEERLHIEVRIIEAIKQLGVLNDEEEEITSKGRLRSPP
jgi:hypothetical protein